MNSLFYYTAGEKPNKNQLLQRSVCINVADGIIYVKDLSQNIVAIGQQGELIGDTLTTKDGSKSVEVEQVTGLNTQFGFRNWFINGGLDIWQRGSAFTGTGYTADRWKVSGVGNTNQGSYNEEYGNTIWFRSTSANAWDWIGQFVELPAYFAGKTMTISYRIKYNKYSPDTFFWLRWGDGTEIATDMGNKSIVGEWQYVTYTFILPDDATDYSHISFRWHGSSDTAGVEYDFTLAQMQLELGDVATPFEQRSYRDELARCQRYFWRGHLGGRGYGYQYSSAGSLRFLDNVTFPSKMRVTPTMSVHTDPIYVGCTFYGLVGSQDGMLLRVNNTSVSYRAYGGVYDADAEF